MHKVERPTLENKEKDNSTTFLAQGGRPHIGEDKEDHSFLEIKIAEQWEGFLSQNNHHDWNIEILPIHPIRSTLDAQLS